MRVQDRLQTRAAQNRGCRNRAATVRESVFLFAALACLVLSGCLPKKSASLHVSPALEALVPSDTVVVLGVNLASIGATPIYQKLITRVPLPQLDEFQMRKPSLPIQIG